MCTFLSQFHACCFGAIFDPNFNTYTGLKQAKPTPVMTLYITFLFPCIPSLGWENIPNGEV